MNALIELYIMKIQTGFITDAEMDRYDELIQLYMVKIKQRLQGADDDN